MSAQKKEKKKLLQTACHVCDKKGCQAAFLACNVAFHTRCALTSKLLLNPPEYAPTIGVPPYPNLPSCAINDAFCTVKVGSAAPTLGTCVVCNHVVPLRNMRTHVGRHILGDECVADACGFCGGNACTTKLLCNGQGKLVSVILTSCPLEPTNVHWGAMAKAFARNPCTNRPMHCTLCKATVWLYGMKMHFDAKHHDVASPATLCAPTLERDVVLTWTAHDEKKEKKKTTDDAQQNEDVDVAMGPPSTLRRTPLPMLLTPLRLPSPPPPPPPRPPPLRRHQVRNAHALRRV